MNSALVVAIIASTALAVAQTEPVLAVGWGRLFDGANTLFGLVFLTEYSFRVWSIAEDKRYVGFKGRMKYAFTPGALIDLAVIVVSLIPMVGESIFPLRLLRIFGIVRLAKLGRFSLAMRHLTHAVVERRYELFITAIIALALIIIGATAMWIAEGTVQPDKFGSIPRSMWWAAVTLTTIGYGDVYPVTIAGKVISIIVAIAGIGLIAMPAGILAAAFSEALTRAGQRR